ncbi:hypothetical protein GW17_00058250 [Ensete ventricosum]|nr:hypothetical protein GW17_00058250 [Ensete ventricosum]
MISQKNSTVIYLHDVMRRVEFRSVFHAPPRKFKILAIPNVLAHGKSYEHDFVKKHEGHILCTNHVQSRVSIGFSCIIPKIQNIGHSQRISPCLVSIGFSCTILEIQNTTTPDVPAHGKSYEHGFTKKCDGHKLCAKSRTNSSFDRFFMHRLENSKYWPFLKYYP